MRILFTGRSYKEGLEFADTNSIFKMAVAQGHEVVSTLEGCPDLLICVNVQKRNLSQLVRARVQNVPSVLVMHEPSVVIPRHANQKVLEKFDKVIKVGRPGQTPIFRCPQQWQILRENKRRLDRAILVNSDKWSFMRGQLYWLRAVVASSNPNVDVFGHAWSRAPFSRFLHRGFELLRTVHAAGSWSSVGIRHVMKTPQAYKGSAEDKVEVMSQYKVALIIENSAEYLSEKIFDAWFAGCIPVYVGPSVEEFGLPPALVVQCDAKSEDGVGVAIERALNADYAEFIIGLKEFLNLKSTQSWSVDSATSSILAAALDVSIER